MDIFNSALKNPVPPIKKDSSEYNVINNQISLPASKETSAAESSVKKKKNSRRKHRNSHLGCGTCKKRRIKCDENLPSCLNCLKGKLHCAYLNLDGPARNALRMAQYNQNLRQDKLQQDSQMSDELKNASVKSANNGNMSSKPNNNSNGNGSNSSINSPNDPLIQQFSSTNPPNAQATFAVPYPIIQSSIAMPTHQQTTAAHVIQSPYGPFVSLQPITAIPTYSQLPVQGIPQPVPHMVYPQHPPPPPQALSHLPPQGPPLQQLPPQMNSIPMQQSSSSESSKPEEISLPPLSNNTLPMSSNPNSLRTSPKLSNVLATLSANHSYNSLSLISNDSSTQELKKSTDNSPVLPPIKPHQANTTYNKTSESPESDREIKLPPITTLNVGGREADSNDKVPTISKLLS